MVQVNPVGGAHAEHLLWQAQLALDEKARLQVVRKMYEMRFGEPPPRKRSVNQLRGIEGARIKRTYQLLARQYGVKWQGRDYNPQQFSAADVPNQALSAATACLYGISEAAILAAGYSPAIGFMHTGKPQSFVYDIADLFKFETVVPLAFAIAAKYEKGKIDQPLESAVRHACRDSFRETRLLPRIIPAIEEVLQAGGLSMPEPPPDALKPAIPLQEASGDVGHRG